MNTVPVFFKISDDQSINDYFTDVYYNYLENLKHSKAPMTDFLLPSYPAAIKNGFNFNFGWMLYSKIMLAGELDKLQQTSSALNMDQVYQQFCFSVSEQPDSQVYISVLYQKQNFTEKQIDSLIRCYYKALEASIENPHHKIKELLDGVASENKQ